MSTKLNFADDADDENIMIESGPFWPKISLKELRETMRIGGNVTTPKIKHAAIGAIVYVNQQLASFRKAAVANGHASLSTIDTDNQVNGESEKCYLYRRAIYSWTNVEILEKYTDYDATDKTAGRADAKQEQADDSRREAHAAVADILGRYRVDCELV